MGDTLYGYTMSEHEYTVTVPELITGDPVLRIGISAHGGGTVGEAYAGNGWDYSVEAGGRVVIEGSDIRSPEGRPAGHAETARSLASFLGAYAEGELTGEGRRARLTYDGSVVATGSEAEAIADHGERLGVWAAE